MEGGFNLEGEEDGKPGRHVCAFSSHGEGMCAQFHGAVEDRFEVSGEAVAGAAVGGGEREAGGTFVVFVRFGFWVRGLMLLWLLLLFLLGLLRRGMRERPSLENDRFQDRWREGDGGEVVDGVEHDDVGRVGRVGVGACEGEDIGVELGGRDGGEVGGVGFRDGDAMPGVEEWGHAVEAFGGELVVGEGAEEFGDEDVDGVVGGGWLRR